MDEADRDLMCPMIEGKLSAFEEKVSSLSLEKDFLIRYSFCEKSSIVRRLLSSQTPSSKLFPSCPFWKYPLVFGIFDSKRAGRAQPWRIKTCHRNVNERKVKGESIPFLPIKVRTEIGVLDQEHEEIHIFSFYIFNIAFWLF